MGRWEGFKSRVGKAACGLGRSRLRGRLRAHGEGRLQIGERPLARTSARAWGRPLADWGEAACDVQPPHWSSRSQSSQPSTRHQSAQMAWLATDTHTAQPPQWDAS